MMLELVPKPQKVTLENGGYRPPKNPRAGMTHHELSPVARALGELFGGAELGIAAPGLLFDVHLQIRDSMHTDVHKLAHEEYVLSVKADGIRLEAGSTAAAWHGAATLRQLVERANRKQGRQCGLLPCVTVRDKPDFAHRALYVDISQGRVPTQQSLFELVDEMARVKLNELQLYIEHVFRFQRHLAIGSDVSALSPRDMLDLQDRCVSRGIELVPSLACFGHMSNVLKHPKYQHLAEDEGRCTYRHPKADELLPHTPVPGWSLSPGVPEVYTFLDELFSEFLPLFASERVNVCCDEVWDLGLGQSYELCRERGIENVFLDHLLVLRELAGKYGKRIMCWGDMLRKFPELLERLPQDVTVLDWHHGADVDPDRLRGLKHHGRQFYACPGVNSWDCLFPRLHEASANIARFAAGAAKHGASGLMNTDWEDGGGYNFMEYSWHGYLLGAERAWNTDADTETFTARFCSAFFGIDKPELSEAIGELGDIAHLHVPPYYGGVWRHIFFAPPDDEVFTGGPRDVQRCRDGEPAAQRLELDARLGSATLERLERLRKVIRKYAGQKDARNGHVLRYWVFAIDTLILAARKLKAFAPGGTDTKRTRQVLVREMARLEERFSALWLERNRPSGLKEMQARYREARQALSAGS